MSKSKAIEQLKSFRGLGGKFNYLGLELTVIAHSRFEAGVCNNVVLPCLSCHYLNNRGEVRWIVFEVCDLPLLLILEDSKNE